MNETIKLQLAHRSIRKFKPEALPQEIVDVLVDVAQHTSTSNYAQSYSILSITDPVKKQELAKVGEQAYIAEAGHLFVLVADQARNAKIVADSGNSTEVFSSFSHLNIGTADAYLASQNMMIAAQSLGLGAVLLGSILNRVDEIVRILELPKLVVPIVGVAVGYPDQEVQMKPRLPKELIHFENTYPQWGNISDLLAEYNKTVTNYYSSRGSNKRIETFEQMIIDWSQNTHPGRLNMTKYIQDQDMMTY